MPPRVCDTAEGPMTTGLPDSARIDALWVEIATGDRADAGTAAHVYLDIGPDEHILDRALHEGAFTRGAAGVWSVPIDDMTVGQLREAPIFLEHDGSGAEPGWYVERVALRLRVAGEEQPRTYLEWKPVGWLALEQPPHTTIVWLSRGARQLRLAGARHLVAHREALYTTAADWLHRVDVHGDSALRSALGELPQVGALASADGALCAVSAETLWRLDPAGGGRTRVGAAVTWPRPAAIAAHGGALYLAAADSLWRVAADGTGQLVGKAGGWPEAVAMVSHADSLYMLAMNGLWRVATTIGGGTLLGAAGQWRGATHLCSHAGSLYVSAAGSLSRVSPDDGQPSLIGAPGSWVGVTGFASLRGSLYVVAQDGFYRAPLDHVARPLLDTMRA